MTSIREAAVARAARVAAPADRPSQRRSSAEPGPAFVRASVVGLELRSKSGSDRLEFVGYASVTEVPYEMYDIFGPYTEIVSAGAFDATLSRQGLDVPFVLAHDSMRRIARTTNGTLSLAMSEHPTLGTPALRVHAPDLDPSDADVAYIAPKLRSGLIDEMSFKFRIDSGQWSPDYDEYRINAVDLHRGDVAIVGFGASPHTAGSGLRSLPTKTGRDIVTPDDLAARRY